MAASSYTTVQGDTWDSIAYRLWGEERHVTRLMDANLDHTDVLIFSAGVRLALPEAPAITTKLMELPPWM